MKKKNMRLVYMLIALAIILGIIYYIDDKPDAVRFDSTLCSFDRDEVTAMEIKPATLDEAMYVYREGEQWKLRYQGKEFMANEDRIRMLMNHFYQLEAQRIVANHERNWPDYNLGQDQAHFISFFSNDVSLCEIYTGRLAFDATRNTTNTNVRKAGDERTYLVSDNLFAQVEAGPESLISQSVAGSFQTERVESVELHHQNEQVWQWMRNAADNTWVNENETAAASDKIQNYLRTVSRWSIAEFHTNLDAAELIPQYSLRIGFDDGTSMKLHIATDDEVAYVSSSYRTDQVVFTTAARSNEIGTLLKSEQGFLPEMDLN